MPISITARLTHRHSGFWNSLDTTFVALVRFWWLGKQCLRSGSWIPDLRGGIQVS